MIEDKIFRIGLRVLSIFTGLLILLIVSTTATDPYELATLDDLSALRAAGILGFMGWLFTYVSTLRPSKRKEN